MIWGKGYGAMIKGEELQKTILLACFPYGNSIRHQL